MKRHAPMLISLFTAVCALIAAVAMCTFVTWLYGALRPAIQFSSATYLPKQGVVCPGQTLDYTVTIYIDRTPAMPSSARSWWSVDEQRTVLPDERLTTTVWTANTPPAITAPASVPVPDLPAGHYEMRTGVRTAALAVYSVPFEIPEGCE